MTLIAATRELDQLSSSELLTPTNTILFARGRIIDGLERMGAKYLPTHKDLKANQRFAQKQRPLVKFKKSASNQPKKGK